LKSDVHRTPSETLTQIRRRCIPHTVIDGRREKSRLALRSGYDTDERKKKSGRKPPTPSRKKVFCWEPHLQIKASSESFVIPRRLSPIRIDPENQSMLIGSIFYCWHPGGHNNSPQTSNPAGVHGSDWSKEFTRDSARCFDLNGVSTSITKNHGVL